MSNDKLKNTQWKKGDKSPNPTGRPPGVRSSRYKRLTKFSHIWGAMVAPDEWFTDASGMAAYVGQGMTVDEFIMLRVKYCLANNIKFVNTPLLVEMTTRQEGKVPLRVLSRPGEDGEEDLNELTDEELRAFVAEIDRRALLAAAKKQKQLEEGENVEESGTTSSGDASEARSTDADTLTS
jgi:hypothetical protein